MKSEKLELRAFHPVSAFSLRFILNIPFALILVISIGLISYLNFQNSANAVNQIANQLLMESAARVHQYLDTYLEIPFKINSLNEDAIRLGQMDIADPQVIERRFLPQMQRFERIAAITWATEQGEYYGVAKDVLGAALVFAETSERTDYAMISHETNSQAEHLNLLHSSPNYDPRPRPWYQAAVNAGQATWTPIFVWTNNNGIGLDAVKPVYTTNGDLMGVLDVSLYLSAISQFLLDVHLSEHGSISIVDDKGMLVASSAVLQPYQSTGDGMQRLDILHVPDPQVQTAMQTVIEQFGDWSNIENSQQIYFDLAGEQQLMQIIPYHNVGLHWWIAIVVPESSYMASINEHNSYTLMLIAASLLVSIVMVSLVASWITRPILQLSHASKAFAAGGWSTRLRIQRNDEIGELATSFNQMADELQQSTVQLQASESRLRAIFENSSDAIVVAQNGISVTVNPAYLTMFGYDSVNDVIGKPILDMVAPSEHDRIREYIRLRSQGEAVPRTYETLGCQQDGLVFDMEVRVSTYYLNAELYSLAILRDISEQKAAQKALIETTELLAQQKYELTERLKELNCLYQHSKIIEQRDIPLEVIAQQTADLLPPAWQYPDITCARLTLEGNTYITGNFKETEWRLSSPITLDNVIQVGLLEVFYLEERSQAFEGVFLREERLLLDEIARRIGQKMKALAADDALLKSYETLEQKVIDRTVQLNTAKEQVEAILNHSVDGLVLIHPDFTIQRTNAAFDRLFACPANTYLKRHLTELFAETSEPIISTLEAQITQGLDAYIAIRARRSDNSVFEAELGIGRIKDEGFVCVVRDITRRKLAEDALRQALATEKELGELKTRFVATASHEFRTPLATILALSETLDAYRHKMKEEEIEECLGQVKGQVVRLKDIVDEVLLLSRIQARKQQFHPVKQNVNAIMLSVIYEFQKRSDIRHQILSSSNDTNYEMLLDAKLLRQVITNLLSNAIKYSPEDKPIEIHLECSAQECVITVRDYGMGIPEQDLKHLFEPFHRASNVGTISGTGLGLVISKASVELHGGTISVHSQLNRGTILTVRIPILA